MAKKRDKDETMEAMRAFERELAENAPQETQSEQTLTFEEWWAAAGRLLGQPNHVREILQADARGRGLTGKHTKEAWDSAAKAYGIRF
jgi:hypothetical protein